MNGVGWKRDSFGLHARGPDDWFVRERLTMDARSLLTGCPKAATDREKNIMSSSVIDGTIGVAMVGCQFMGGAHSFGWRNVNGQRRKRPSHAATRPRVRMRYVVGLPEDNPCQYAIDKGWEQGTISLDEALQCPDVHVVDICTPNSVHAEQAEAALAAGKHVNCEKPISNTLDGARRMRDLAVAAKACGLQTGVNHQYRRAPAAALMQQEIAAGDIGEVCSVRGVYLQDWATADVPLFWRFLREQAGSGALGDLLAHVIDFIRFSTGLEFDVINGATERTMIPERYLTLKPDGTKLPPNPPADWPKGTVTVDDHVSATGSLVNGAVVTMEAARQTWGHLNGLTVEVSGTKGARRFSFPDMNALMSVDAATPRKKRGWTRISCTNMGDHPYMGNWWPDDHLIGYGEGHCDHAADFVDVVTGFPIAVPLPDFEDAFKTTCVLEAVHQAALCGRACKLESVQ